LAVEHSNVHQQKHFTTRAFDSLICIIAPASFIELAEATLIGWRFVEQKSSLAKSDIIVAYRDNLFHVDSTVLDNPKVVDDLLDALNEFFLCLSYLLANKTQEFSLLHCASYTEAGKNIILLGDKKSGKSAKTLSKTIAGELIYADDLLLWHAKRGIFVALGLPLRLRRTMIPLIDSDTVKDKFIIGKNILYSHQNFFNNAKLGDEFLLDQLKLMSENFDFAIKDIPVYKTLFYLKQHLIAGNFISIKNILQK
jgi:hypothetical protein